MNDLGYQKYRQVINQAFGVNLARTLSYFSL
jgi:hypothetical protein